MLNYSQNPYNVLSEIISFENVQKMGEMLTLKTLRTRSTYPRYNLEWLYRLLGRIFTQRSLKGKLRNLIFNAKNYALER